MAKITWENRADSGSLSAVSASIFNDTKTSVNELYDVVNIQLGTTSSLPDEDLHISGTINVSGSIIPNTSGKISSSFDLGSPTAAWRDLYVSTGSLKFVGPGGVISSMSKQDVDNIKGGKPIPTTPRTITRGGTDITVSTYNETDAIISETDNTDSTYILFDRDGANRDRVTITAGNQELAAFQEGASQYAPGNANGVATVGKTGSTTLLNASDTVVMENKRFAISGSMINYGKRGLSQPPLPTPDGLYEGEMNTTRSLGLAKVTSFNGNENPAPFFLDSQDELSAIVWVTPNGNNDGDVGKARYNNGDYIFIEEQAPYATGFTTTCSFSIPFSASSANNQKIEVELVQLPAPISPEDSWDEGTFHDVFTFPNGTRTFVIDPANFSSGFVTGTLEAEWHISSEEFGSSYAVTSSGEGKPTLTYFNQPIEAITHLPLQLRVRNGYTSEAPFVEEWQARPPQPSTIANIQATSSWHSAGNLNPYGGFSNAEFRNPLYGITLADWRTMSSPNTNGALLSVPWTIDQTYNPVVNENAGDYSPLTAYDETGNFNTSIAGNNGLGWKMSGSGDLENGWVVQASGDYSFYANLKLAIFQRGLGLDQILNPPVEIERYTVYVKKQNTAGEISTVAEVTRNVNIYSLGNETSSPFATDMIDLQSTLENIQPHQAGYVEHQQLLMSQSDMSDHPVTGRRYMNMRETTLICTNMPGFENVSNFIEGGALHFDYGDRVWIEIGYDPVGEVGWGACNDMNWFAGSPIAAYNAGKSPDEGILINGPNITPSNTIYNRFVQKWGIRHTSTWTLAPWTGPVTLDTSYVVGGVQDNSGLIPSNSAFFQLGNEFYPGLTVEDCNETGFSLGVNAGGEVIANGGYLSVGPLSGALFPFNGSDPTGVAPDLGNIISCSADNVLAVGEFNDMAFRNTLGQGYGNILRADNAAAMGYLNQVTGEAAQAFGKSNKAMGQYSHAEGNTTVASGSAAHSEGTQTKALANHSHAEGNTTIAEGESSHAEGLYSTAEGEGSHAEGGATRAIGAGSHAEGSLTRASGSYSHAQGYRTLTTGNQSHAEGWFTTASGESAHAEGSNTDANGFASHAEGDGTLAQGYASHAEGVNAIALGDNSHAEGLSTKAFGNNSHAEGEQTRANGAASHAEGSFTSASGLYSHAEGLLTKAVGVNSHAEGYGTLAQGASSHAEGMFTTASSDFSHAEGWKSTAWSTGSHAEGRFTSASGMYSHAEGDYSRATGNYSHAEGSSTATATYAHSEGRLTVASGLNAHAEGNETLASGNDSHAEGYQTTASAGISHAEGYGSVVGVDGSKGTGGHAEGYFTQVKGNYGHAEGSQTVAEGTGSHAEGSSSLASGTAAHAEGFATLASGFSAHAEGSLATGSGNYSHAEGMSTKATGAGSHAEGSLTVASGNNAHAEGLTTEASGDNAHAEGEGTTASGTSAHAEGQNTLASANYAHAEGAETKATGIASHAEGKFTSASGASSHAEGWTTIAAADYAHAEGSGSSATGNYSHAEGASTVASGISAHAEGESTLASGYTAHAEGFYTLASGFSAHAEGSLTTASANYAHAEGVSSRATGAGSHAEGSSTLASGTNSHAEGLTTVASGLNAHAEGEDTLASGTSAHAEGQATTASGNYAHAEGRETFASGSQSHAEGAFTSASAQFAHAEGSGSKVTGVQVGDTYFQAVAGHAEGVNTLVTHPAAHAEGRFTTASSYGAHAEGEYTKATGNFAHAEGEGTTASGRSAHAQGASTVASGDFSFASGESTEAGGDYSVAFGQGSKARYSHEFVVGKYLDSNNLGVANRSSFLVGQYNATGSSAMGNNLGSGYFINFGIGDGAGQTNRSNVLEIWSHDSSDTAILLDTGSLPTSDPSVIGQLYRTGSNSDEIRISLG